MTYLQRVFIFVLCSVFTTEGRLENEEWKIHMEQKMEEMFQLIERQNDVIEKQSRFIEGQSKEIKNLESKVQFIESKSVLGIVNDQTEKVNKMVNKTERKLGNVKYMHEAESKKQQIRRFLSPGLAEGHVAFYAYISKDFGGVGVDHVFLYDTVVTNYGNAYSQHTGAFTAPTSGVYAFSYTIYASGEHVAGESGDYGEVSVQLVHNGAYKGSIHVDTETNWEEEMSTGFAILMLQAGDTVLTMSKGTGEGSFHSNESGRWSFAGFQIA
ncbi:heavy metal-binding protein HIP-like [Saccostrea echinata]|uniref:heavy metal-binding protein HIP-like n=1 Tax=Saccostrea echinata TaxID=191078 RepID=UPI002A8249F9|nr:heavy metal-binding protein HIP-like [Saccostrea echinata]